jgi:DNA polymerase-1
MSDKAHKRVFIIDGNSFCYRAFYAVRHLSNSKGQPTNAIFGVLTMIKKIIKDQKPDMMAVAFDLKGPTFRHKRYEDYKITRKPMPDDLISQMPYIKKLIQAYNIPIYELQGYEADDVLATIAERAAGSGLDAYIVTSDKDALQLIGRNIKVYNPHHDGMVYGEQEVRERFGVGPDKITDLMGLMGDSTDNIPGVPGIGEKTAIELMRQFESLDELMANLHKVKSESRRKKIEEARDLAFLSKELATLKRDVPLSVDLADLIMKEPDEEALRELFKELEFRSLLKDIAEVRSPKGAYHLVDTKAAFTKLVTALGKTRRCAFDFETTHFDPMKAEPVGISVCWEEGTAYYVPFNGLRDLSREDVIEALKPVFEDENVKKVGHNIKYDILCFRNLGVSVRGIEFDTMVASYLLNPSKPNHNLKDSALEYLDRAMTPIDELIGKGKKAITMAAVDIRKVCDYSCADSDVTLALRAVLLKQLREKGLDKLFYDVEMPLVAVLADMEWQGVSIDETYLGALSGEMEKETRRLKKDIFRLAGEEFNVNSSKQLQGILFHKMKMPVIKRTKTGISTDEEVLTQLAEKEALPKEILRYRELAKLQSTYVDSLPELVNKRTKRIHTSFNQTVTATGRLSSSAPNLQNIPIKTKMGRKIRKAFIAEKKSQRILSADYSQIELRILAHLSRDENLTAAFEEDRDIHAFTASLVYGVPEKEITSEMRQAAKTVNFGIVYGMSAYGLSKDLGIDVREASQFIDAYFERYPRVKECLDSIIRDAREKGYVTTLLGRRRPLPEINSSNIGVRNFTERAAVNTPIQGTAADLIKLAMIAIQPRLPEYGAKMILQVHDELVFEIDKKRIKPFAACVKNCMERVMDLSVPIKVHLEAGEDWLDTEEVLL